MKTFQAIGTEIGELVERKNAAYGSSVAVAGEFLALLYPDGLKPAQYAHALLLVRIFDKQKRIATDADAFGESPFADIAGYGILGAHMHQTRKASEPWPGTASADAAKSSEAKQPDSAEPNASGSISPSASATTASEPLPQPASCSATRTSAPARTATELASQSAAALRQNLEMVFAQLVTLMRQCNRYQLCAKCGELVAGKVGGSLMSAVWNEYFVVCARCAPEANQWRSQLETTRSLELPASEEDRNLPPYTWRSR